MITHVGVIVVDRRKVDGLVRLLTLPIALELVAGCLLPMAAWRASGVTAAASAGATAVAYFLALVIYSRVRIDHPDVASGADFMRRYFPKWIRAFDNVIPGFRAMTRSHRSGRTGPWARFVLINVLFWCCCTVGAQAAPASHAVHQPTGPNTSRQPARWHGIKGCGSRKDIERALRYHTPGDVADRTYVEWKRLGSKIARCVWTPRPVGGAWVAEYMGGTGGHGFVLDLNRYASYITPDYGAIRSKLKQLDHVSHKLRAGLGTMYLLTSHTGSCVLMERYDNDPDSLTELPASVTSLALQADVVAGSVPFLESISYAVNGIRTYRFRSFVPDRDSDVGYAESGELRITYNGMTGMALMGTLHAQDTDACLVSEDALAQVAGSLEDALQYAASD